MNHLAEDLSRMTIINDIEPTIDSSSNTIADANDQKSTPDSSTRLYQENNPEIIPSALSPPTSIQARNRKKTRDPTWLQVEVCREYLRGECARGPEECRFAHPKPHCAIENGKVTTCFDSLKFRCTRERCKYYHPPKHIKQQIQHLGKTFQNWNYRHNHNEVVENSENQHYQMVTTYSYFWYSPWNLCFPNNMYHYQNTPNNYLYYGYMGQPMSSPYYNISYDDPEYYNSDNSYNVNTATRDKSTEKVALVTEE